MAYERKMKNEVAASILFPFWLFFPIVIPQPLCIFHILQDCEQVATESEVSSKI